MNTSVSRTYSPSSCPLYTSPFSCAHIYRFTATNMAGKDQNTYQERATVSARSSSRAAWVAGYQHSATSTQHRVKLIMLPTGDSQ